MYLSAWLSRVPWEPSQAWGALYACSTADTLDALSTRRPWFTWLTLMQQEDGEREKWNGTNEKNKQLKVTSLIEINYLALEQYAFK